ncbi:class I SAM-dependent methyltransferase [Clostridium sp. AL.422]|uniref:class I SAM-dependent methyltransferase n=1 Tax=Clostridium TaxID=1485 RepID=UPI00293DECA3|nr:MULTISPECIES: class I SAM-dependent methyltransferase [unclassified Clostridium]MDV4150759.1 class I SAM-dependent methyltransferase [Clostridium sp. AL.422]
MRENKYDDNIFFDKYSKMKRSIYGLQGAGEWETFKSMLPNFENKRVLDLGCGFGWHCKYAIENNAIEAIGVDLSEKMLERAKEINGDKAIKYINLSIEEVKFDSEYFDTVISSLAFHYVKNFDKVCQNVYDMLKDDGDFIFSVEHPIFTAYGNQEWYYNEEGNKLHWPIDNYFYEGIRETNFLGECVRKYHKTLTTYINSLLKCGFTIREVIEPTPTKEMLDKFEDMTEELRRPMMLLISAKK